MSVELKTEVVGIRDAVNQLKKTPHIPSLTHSTAQILKNGKVTETIK